MINGLRGKIISRDLDEITIDVNGVCYRVFVSHQFLDKICLADPNEDVYIQTYLSVRENALDLYGFIDQEDKKLFQLLLSISGIGPKSAISIMNSVTKEMIEEGINKNDASYLSKIAGIGKKTAEKIIMGLKDKVGVWGENYSCSPDSDGGVAIDALVSLGYSIKDARDSIKLIDTKNKNTEDIIKEALKKLS